VLRRNLVGNVDDLRGRIDREDHALHRRSEIILGAKISEQGDDGLGNDHAVSETRAVATGSREVLKSKIIGLAGPCSYDPVATARGSSRQHNSKVATESP